ncbi:related to Phosphoglycerate mutase 2 [Saccharomycodes ludwigii]|uniref:phosphoglycerate mutase (2,3-diphosphoglycerate-dependent) n=1 Tax=Saccharomycodes ludwigii TaxID=36035 RepID=A0A376B5P2_9ASCO|nr:hypothetical protein SCDLUD_005143 [Saccharomycodes ludwigii]KAH3898805.1 hypothetical protein SCDLUD_005143 [Saccharomycodes ludwigii]SSD59983.1 related to Phosphoglycerate mutase 2 [Saccharomycodes ludwigii]
MSESNNIIKLFILRHGQSELNHENIFCGWIDAKLTQQGMDQARSSAKLIKQYLQKENIKVPTIGFTSRLTRTKQTLDTMLEELGQSEKKQVNVLVDNTDGEKQLDKKHPFQVIRVDSNTASDNNKNFQIYRSWRLNERHYGSWQGQRKPKILNEYGKEKYMFIRRDYNGKPPVVDLNKEMENEDPAAAAASIVEEGEEEYAFKEPNRKLKYDIEYKYGDITTLPDSESLSDVVERLKPLIYEFILPRIKDTDNKSGIIVGHGSSVRSILKILCDISDDDIKDVNIPNGIPLVLELQEVRGTSNEKSFKFLNKFYLDPELAKVNAEKVKNEGFQKGQ